MVNLINIASGLGESEATLSAVKFKSM